ncbi:MAG: tRNA (adenosine(37)-N6)-dimethylallyltransferase MiaA [Candidatus Azobacteroides sp.]|nr:tRNA (adenosine(37)-N6)-dimethylallyltransferase MiaA [Candidatus Azobacteroides sp.]
MKNKTLIVLLGPTGVGKTGLSLTLAEYLSSPVISCDSRQLYSRLKIGTAAPTPDQLTRVPHYFVGILNLDEYYSAARFESEVLEVSEKLFEQTDHILMTGGSMMYIDAVCKGIDDLPTVDAGLRAGLLQTLEQEGLEPLRNQLKILDPEFYRRVDLKNSKRVLHALEICLMTGKSYTSLRTNTRKQRPFNIVKIGLMRDREDLYGRINARVDEMIAQGLVDEAKELYPYKDLNSLNTVGYKELFRYFEGGWTLEEAVDKIKQNTRIYSRKQMTWFKRDETVKWFHPDEKEQILTYLKEKLLTLNCAPDF